MAQTVEITRETIDALYAWAQRIPQAKQQIMAVCNDLMALYDGIASDLIADHEAAYRDMMMAFRDLLMGMDEEFEQMASMIKAKADEYQHTLDYVARKTLRR